MRHLVFAALSVVCLFASDRDFNGRWDIRVQENERKRAWWLEVKDAGTQNISGLFVGAPGGQMDKLPVIRVEDGELRFEIKDGIYKARLEKGQLTGTYEAPGNKTLQWTGMRAPKLGGGDPRKYHEGEPIELFNGKDLAGWSLLRPEKNKTWTVSNGVLKNEPDASDIVTNDKFWNFRLQVQFRVGPKSNSGLGLRGRYEIQIYDDFGQPPSLHGNGAIYSRTAPVVNASRPAGQWQTFDITLIGNEATVILNQAKIIDRKEIEGLTAIASDPNEAEPGPLQIQGDHGSVEFRKITLIPLLKGKPKN